jgi:hypothetical protein
LPKRDSSAAINDAKAMEDRLWNQELFVEFCQEFTRERNRLHGEASAAASAAQKELAVVE